MATDLYEISGLCVDVEYMIMGVLANNVYIVSDGEGTMVVDPSCSADKILAALGERKLDVIVLTHSHFRPHRRRRRAARGHGCARHCVGH